MFDKDLLKTLKGMCVISPSNTYTWSYVENVLIKFAEKFGYSEVRFPVLERTKLFNMSIGRDTDIVYKEMFTFTDKGGEVVTLRPEGTVCCVRSVKECGLLRNSKSLKLWYLGDMFRRERPQKGRYRQFKQFGIEFFYCKSKTEIELFIFVDSVFHELGLQSKVNLRINTVGCINDLKRYKKFLEQQRNNGELSGLHTKGFRRFLDKSLYNTSGLIRLPVFFEFLCTASVIKFAHLVKELRLVHIVFIVDLRLIRGLAYYDHMVYEWVQQLNGRTQTICAGGRYTLLVKEFSKESYGFTTGVALGVDRLVELYIRINGVVCRNIDVFVDLSSVASFDVAQLTTLINLKKYNSELKFYFVFEILSVRRAIKNADKANAAYIIVVDIYCYLNDCVKISKTSVDKISLYFNKIPLNTITRYVRLHKL